jgi:hypothetical protein
MAKAVTHKDSWIAAQFLKGAPAGCEKQGEDGNLGGGRGGLPITKYFTLQSEMD